MSDHKPKRSRNRAFFYSPNTKFKISCGPNPAKLGEGQSHRCPDLRSQHLVWHRGTARLTVLSVSQESLYFPYVGMASSLWGPAHPGTLQETESRTEGMQTSLHFVCDPSDLETFVSPALLSSFPQNIRHGYLLEKEAGGGAREKGVRRERRREEGR